MTTIRPVQPSDLATICSQRRRMFAEMGIPTSILDQVETPFRDWLAARLADGTYFGFIADQAGLPIGGIGLILQEWAPNPLHPTTDLRGYILNVFVEPPHRGQGLATELLQRGEAELRSRGITYVTLHASEFGRPLYEKHGWLPTTQMSKSLYSLVSL